MRNSYGVFGGGSCIDTRNSYRDDDLDACDDLIDDLDNDEDDEEDDDDALLDEPLHPDDNRSRDLSEYDRIPVENDRGYGDGDSPSAVPAPQPGVDVSRRRITL